MSSLVDSLDEISEDRVVTLILQALFLKRVILCDYLYQAFLNGSITSIDDYQNIHKVHIAEEYINPMTIPGRNTNKK
jgi:hypothetical protein